MDDRGVRGQDVLSVPNPADPSGETPAFLPRSIIDPKGGRNDSRGRKILVVSTVENAGDKLNRFTNPDDTVMVVVPAVRQGFLDWLANDQEAFAEAEEVASETAAALPGHAVRASAGEADVALAIRDALATFAADEIIVAVRSDEDAGIVESIATRQAPQRSVEGVPVRCIVVSEAA
jgi:hypothetical protein